VAHGNVDASARAVGLERLGASDAFADFLVSILGRHGWSVSWATAFAGGVMAIASSPSGLEFRRAGASRPEAALAVFEDVARLMGMHEHVQLPLFSA
jgi:hypothetical protein